MKTKNRILIAIGGAFGFASAPIHATPTVIARYQLGEAGSLGTNSRPQDSAGTYHYTGNGSYTGATPTGTTDLYAPGSTAYLDTSDTTKPEGFWGPTFTLPGSNNFAFGIYVRAAANTAATQGAIFTIGNPTTNSVMKLELASGGWSASAHNIAWIGPGGGTGFHASQWVHLAVVRYNGVSTMYLNGVPQAGTWSGTPVIGASHLNLNSGGTTAFDGQVDEARVVTFANGDAVNDILALLTDGAPSHLVNDQTKTLKSLALGAGLDSHYRPGTDVTTVVDDGGFTVAATHNLHIASSPTLTPGVYDLIHYTASSPVNLADFNLVLPTGMVATLVNANPVGNAQTLQVDITDTGSKTWNGDVSNVWDTGISPGTGGTFNWTTSTSSTNFVTGDDVVFNELATSFEVAINGADVSPGLVSFDHFGETDYLFTGDHGITGATGVTKTGTGTAIFANPNSYSGTTTVSAGTLRIGNGGTTGTPGSGALVDNGTIELNRSDSWTLPNVVSGTGTLAHVGSGTADLTGAVSCSTLRSDSGVLKLSGTPSSPVLNILTAGVLEIHTVTTYDYPVSTTITGTGTLRKSGAGEVHWLTPVATWALGSGALIDVQEGTLTGGSSGNDVWTNNKADLNVAAGAIFDAVEGSSAANGGVFVDALSGAGTIKSGYDPGYGNKLTFGVDNGSGTFDGVLADSQAPGVFIKTGTGTQILNGANTYTGNTTVNGGTLELGSTSELRFVPNNTSSNKITGAAAVTLGGAIVIAPSGITVTNATWSLIDVATLNETYSGSFSVKAADGTPWTNAAGTWTHTDVSGNWFFDQSTGVLTLSSGNDFASWMGGFTFAPGADTTATGDADGDGIPNLIENVLGTDPSVSTPGLTQVSATPGTLVFKHPVNGTLASDVTYTYVWSTDLSEWKASGESNTGGTSVTIGATTTAGVATVTVTPGTVPKVFVRLQAGQNP